MTNEFNDDPGAASRFLSLCIIPIVAVILLTVVFFIIPFTRKLTDYSGLNHRSDIAYADLYAATAVGKVFIGENELSIYDQTSETIPVPKDRKREIEAAVTTLHKLIGK
jgi:hypothetical protein